MPSLQVRIAEEIGERHPDIQVGGLRASNLRAAATTMADRPFPVDTAVALVSQDVTIELVADHPLIRDWRTAIAACGLKPSTYKSRPEQLARRTLNGDMGRTGLALVDLYCEVATRHLASLGGYDIDRLPAEPIELRLADPASDIFVPLGGGGIPITERVVVYAAGPTVLRWAYNCRDSRETCLTEDTDSGLFLGEAVTAGQHEALRTALDDLSGRLTAAGAEVGPIVFAGRDQPHLTFDLVARRDRADVASVPDQEPSPGCPLPPEARAVLEDRLGRAGLDVFGPRREVAEGVPDDGDPVF